MEPTSPVSATTLEEDDSLSDVSPATAQHMESPMENLSVPAAVAVGASARGVPGRRTKHKVPDRGVLHDITSAVFATTRFAVLNPAAVVAAPLASLTLDQLKSLLPDHVASRVCVAGVDLAAKLSGVVADSDEGVAARRAVVKLATATLDCAATPEGQRVFVAGAEAALRGAAPRGGDRDKKALVALRAATRAALRVAASNEADVAVKRGFHALDAAMALAQSEPVHRAVREAVDDVVDALAERHAERTQTRNAQKRAMHRGDVSRRGAEGDETPFQQRSTCRPLRLCQSAPRRTATIPTTAARKHTTTAAGRAPRAARLRREPRRSRSSGGTGPRSSPPAPQRSGAPSQSSASTRSSAPRRARMLAWPAWRRWPRSKPRWRSSRPRSRISSNGARTSSNEV
ncbi:hypothetical protein M885DRAFT_161036 [Pelagophyceae sp. CCMP2097]|nr:hypothetical protein M885DRAFT_161036 [Pelagophyceae sp. CCMP2097]